METKDRFDNLKPLASLTSLNGHNVTIKAKPWLLVRRFKFISLNSPSELQFKPGLELFCSFTYPEPRQYTGLRNGVWEWIPSSRCMPTEALDCGYSRAVCLFHETIENVLSYWSFK